MQRSPGTGTADDVDTPFGRRYEVIGPGRGRVVHCPAPEAGPGEAVVRVLANGVCASELTPWSTAQAHYPVRLGHEPVGTVAATGAGVELHEGARVTGRILESYADYALADVRDLVRVPDGIDTTTAALGEPLGCVVEAVRRTPVGVGDRVAVVGLGFMGLCMLQLLVRSPVSHLCAIDLRAGVRTTATDLGADAAAHPDELSDGTDAGDDTSRSFDVVVEATGTQPGLDLATRIVADHGAISVLGYHRTQRQVDMKMWNWKAIDVVNAHVRDRRLLRDSTRRGLAMIAAERIDLRALVTHRYTLDSVDDAFAALRDKPDGLIKAVVIMADDSGQTDADQPRPG